MENKYTQIVESSDSDTKSEDSEKETSKFENVDDILTSETESEGNTSTEIDFISNALPFASDLPESLALEARIAKRHGIKTSTKKIKFLVPTDPNLFNDCEVTMRDNQVAKWYLQYIKEEHEKKRKEKQLSFFQRKVKKLKKRFKNKNKK